jgi:protein SCO1/2
VTVRRASRTLRTVAPALALAALLGGCASGQPEGRADVRVNGASGWAGTAVTAGYPLPDQTFTDTSGDDVVPAEDAADGVTLVFFGYSHCPDICNVVLANIASALRGSPASVRDSTRVLFVTTDPARDTPTVVRGYLDRFDPAFEGLVAPVGTVEQAAKQLHVSYERPDGSTGGYEVEHGTYTTAFVDGEATVVWSDTTAVADLRADLRRLARLA